MASPLHCLLRFAVCLLGISGIALSASAQQRPFPGAFPSFYVGPENGVAPITLDDGSTLWMGREQPLARSVAGVVAVVKIRGDSTPDSTFGSGGIVRLPVFGASDWPKQILAESDGRLVVAVSTLDPTFTRWCYYADCPNYLALFRLNADGKPEASFSGDGRVVVRLGPPIHAGDGETGPIAQTKVVTGPADSIALLHEGASDTTPALATVSASGEVRGGSTDAWEVADSALAVMFHHPVLDQYFETTLASELGILPSLGWIWLGEAFRVDPAGSPAPGLVPVCRYYRNPASDLGPAGTPGAHFQSAIAEECAWLANQPDDWILESEEVYRVALPDAATGICTPGRIPVYRLWNGRADGGHLLTTSIAQRNQILARSPPYVPEGYGPLGVAMCARPPVAEPS